MVIYLALTQGHKSPDDRKNNKSTNNNNIKGNISNEVVLVKVSEVIGVSPDDNDTALIDTNEFEDSSNLMIL